MQQGQEYFRSSRGCFVSERSRTEWRSTIIDFESVILFNYGAYSKIMTKKADFSGKNREEMKLCIHVGDTSLYNILKLPIWGV